MTEASSNNPFSVSQTALEDVYIQTTSNSFVSRQATIQGSDRVDIKGRSVIEHDCTLEGDKARITIGRFCYIQSGTCIRPAAQPGGTAGDYVPVSIGSHTLIGHDCTIEAAAIGSECWIGNNVKLGKRVIIKDCCVVRDNAEIPNDTVLAPFSRVQAPTRPELQWSFPNYTELSPAVSVYMQERSIELYTKFAARQS
jgi:dynactin-5